MAAQPLSPLPLLSIFFAERNLWLRNVVHRLDHTNLFWPLCLHLHADDLYCLLATILLCIRPLFITYNNICIMLSILACMRYIFICLYAYDRYIFILGSDFMVTISFNFCTPYSCLFYKFWWILTDLRILNVFVSMQNPIDSYVNKTILVLRTSN